ncbi:phytase [Lactarius akahatsu]|uniref:Phytase A n=1 Tax=Lactarius akahatsu TaxID=416441 RepID=A0AAD4QHW2_9AGAM|nr:phytase [Lactarius akahatsu]
MAKDVISKSTERDHPPLLVNEPSHLGKRRCRRTVQLLVLATFLGFWLRIIPFKWPSLSLRQGTVLPVDHVPDIGLPESLMRTWAQYAPYIPVAKYVPPPPMCTISQVHVLQRHGTRWPTSNAAAKCKSAVDKLKRVKDYEEDYLVFLKNFTWDLGENDLLPLGARQSFDAGVAAFDRYAHIVSNDNLPFVRAASSTRVVDSATNWTAGFNVASHNTIKASVDLILPESGNLTLDDNMCPNAGDGDAESERWLAIYAPPITRRLNLAAPGANLSNKDTYNLMSLCAFHSQATMTPSPFCGLFTPEEFRGFEYFGDVDKFYDNGHGGNLGRVRGVGYVNELLARLTGKPVRDNTQTNRTLDASPETFPLDRTLYADFSHDNTMVSIYSALGLFRQYLLPGQKLNPGDPSSLRTWILSNMVPFGGRMVVERLKCTRAAALPAAFIRILVNDAVQPLKFCGGVRGLCELHAFVESQWYSRHDGGGDFERCFD